MKFKSACEHAQCFLGSNEVNLLYLILVGLRYMAQSSEQAPFISEFVGSILAMDSCEKSQSTLCRKSWVSFLRVLRFLPTGKVDRVG